MSEKQKKPPAWLSAKSRRWFTAVAGQFVFETEAEWSLLEQAAGVLDRLDEARAAIAEHGLLVPTGQGGLKPNPAANLERDNRILLARLLRELRMSEPGDDSRIPGIGR